MYGIYANIGGILMAHVTIYGIHGSYGDMDPVVHAKRVRTCDFTSQPMVLMGAGLNIREGKSFTQEIPCFSHCIYLNPWLISHGVFQHQGEGIHRKHKKYLSWTCWTSFPALSTEDFRAFRRMCRLQCHC